MNAKSKKAKGGAFEKAALEVLKQYDSKAYRIFGSGAGLEKGDLYSPTLKLLIECKNHRQLSIVDWMEQTKRQGNDFNKSILLFKNPKSPDANPEIYATLSIYDLMDLITSKQEVKTEVKDDRQLKYDISNLAMLAKKVLKQLENE